MTDNDEHLASLDRRIKAALGPHWFIGDGALWATWTNSNGYS
jgi:hypothetical protein